MHDDPELLNEFLLESRENLDRLDAELVLLEASPGDGELLASVFRSLHTLKGTAGFFGFKRLQAVAHAGEALLSRLREGVVAFDASRATVLLQTCDALRRIVEHVAEAREEGAGDDAALVGALAAASGERPAMAAAPADAAPRGPVVFDPPDGSALVSAPAVPVHGAAAPPPADHEKEPRIRVDVSTLDRLMNLVGELVLARNQLVNAAASIADPTLAATVQRVSLITGELQEGVMKTRMQPIQSVWSRYPRVVRDLATACGKRVHLEVEGASTELDRSIIEAIADPLTHLVRNAIDHGIELPAGRAAAGKPESGRLRLRASHEGGRVTIELDDDGAGIDPVAVADKAVARGLISAARAGQLSAKELFDLVFLPGFSTVESVSRLSGRGVGMDVVRTNVERIGGSVELESAVGRGTSVRLRLPLTLAIIPGLIVGTGGERFAVPQLNLVELLLIEADAVATTVERLHGAPFMRVRGRLLPLVDLGGVLGLSASDDVARDWHVVVVQADGARFGLVVDDISDTEEIVVKPIGRYLRGLDAYAGATIMGDGKVALILDVKGLAARAGVRGSERQIAAPSPLAAPPAHDEPARYLVLKAGGEAPMALPLAAVDRLEEFDLAAVERVGGVDCVQYRGGILELAYLSDLFGGARAASDLVRVVVHTRGGRSLGLVVEEIADVVEPETGFVRHGGRRGVAGAMVIHGRVTEILDADTVHAMAQGAR